MNPAAPLPLRDIHLPDPVSWWPPAPGWWLLLICIIVTASILYYLPRLRKKAYLRQQALQELQRVETAYIQNENRQQALQQLSVFLRRVALSRYPRAQVAALTGQHWLRFLDRPLQSEDFSKGPGRCLEDGPYKPATDGEMQPVFDLCRRWLDAEFKRDLKNISRAETRI